MQQRHPSAHEVGSPIRCFICPRYGFFECTYGRKAEARGAEDDSSEEGEAEEESEEDQSIDLLDVLDGKGDVNIDGHDGSDTTEPVKAGSVERGQDNDFTSDNDEQVVC